MKVVIEFHNERHATVAIGERSWQIHRDPSGLTSFKRPVADRLTWEGCLYNDLWSSIMSALVLLPSRGREGWIDPQQAPLPVLDQIAMNAISAALYQKRDFQNLPLAAQHTLEGILDRVDRSLPIGERLKKKRPFLPIDPHAPGVEIFRDIVHGQNDLLALENRQIDAWANNLFETNPVPLRAKLQVMAMNFGWHKKRCFAALSNRAQLILGRKRNQKRNPRDKNSQPLNHTTDESTR